jgi:hypothetical protein
MDASKYLYFVADVPHLIKNLKSMLLKHVFKLPQNVCEQNNLSSPYVSADHLKAVAIYQQQKDLLLAPNLTLSLFTPGHFKKMKVSQALNVFSKASSAAIRYLVKEEDYPEDMNTTAWFVDQANHWFDLLSSRHPVMALSKLKLEKYEEAVQFLKSFSHTISQCSIGEKGDWKPVQTGIVLSTNSILQAAEDLLQTSSFVLTSRFTQDCLENLFSTIRFKNPIPTPLEFKNALKLISVSQFLKIPSSSSYDIDESDYLADFLSIQTAIPVEPADELDGMPITCTEFSSTPQLLPGEESSLYYLAGYCVQSLNKQRQLCDTCVHSVKNTEEDSHVSSLLRLKEYVPDALFSVSAEVFDICRKTELRFRQLEPQIKSISNPRQTIVQDMMNNDGVKNVNLPVCHDVKMKIINKYVTVRLQILCKKLRGEISTSSVSLGSKSTAMHDLVNRL